MTTSSSTYLLRYLNNIIEVCVGYDTYSNNNSLAVLLLSRGEENCSEQILSNDTADVPFLYNEVFGVITVNLESSTGLPADEQYVDVNNYPQIENWLIDNNLASPLGRIKTSGRVNYPLYRFILPGDKPRITDVKRL